MWMALCRIMTDLLTFILQKRAVEIVSDTSPFARYVHCDSLLSVFATLTFQT